MSARYEYRIERLPMATDSQINAAEAQLKLMATNGWEIDRSHYIAPSDYAADALVLILRREVQQ